MDIKDKLKAALLAACEKAMQEGIVPQGELPEVFFEVPPQKSFGDFATNFAMQAAKSLRFNPRALAQAIEKNIQSPYLDKVEIAGPGFMNFFLTKDWLFELLSEIDKKGENYGNLTNRGSDCIQVEYVSANPTGPLHVGHGRGAAVGSTLVNIMRAAGYNVKSEYYINDAGNQINNLAASVNARYLELLEVPCEFPEDGYHGVDIIETAKRIINADGDKYLPLPTKDRLAIFKELALKEKNALLKEDLEKFNVTFDNWFSEQTLHDNKEIETCCKELTQRGYMYEKDGAKWLKSTAFGDDKDRVVIRENGVPTYLAADIAYHKDKFARGFTHLIDLWGADHHGYIKRMRAACEALGYKGEQFEVLILQMVSLYRDGELVKMSKRTGQSVTLNELIEEVGTDAARYFFVMRSIDSQLDFDMTLAADKSKKNPVHYIQYAHARICTLFRNVKEAGIQMPTDNANLALLQDESEIDLIKKLGEYEDEIANAAKERAPHRIANFSYEIARMFHYFYDQCRILGIDSDLQQSRLVLVRVVKNCLKHSLAVMGISAPEQM